MKKIITSFFAISCTMQLFAQGTFNISAGTRVQYTGGVYLVFNDINLVNDGILQPSAGTIKFSGVNDESISGSGTTTIDSLKLAKSSTSSLNLQSNITVGTSVNFISGLINLGNNVLDLGFNGMLLNESETSRAYTTGTGYIQATQTLNAPSSANPGNLGAIITSSGNLGSTVVRRGDTAVTSITNSSILRNYTITPTNDAGLNATYRFKYFDAELNGLDESTLDFWKSNNGTTWVDSGVTTRDAVNNYVEKTGVNDFSVWTLSTHVTILPVTITSLNAYTSSNTIIVGWQVQTELNVNRYEVQRSNDGKNFATIGALTAIAASNYSYTDNQPFTGSNFYRLRIVDANGSIKYSSIVAVSSNNKTSGISFFPNPVVDNTVTLQLGNLVKGVYQLIVLDNAGKPVYQNPVVYDGGSSAILIHLPATLSSGIYRVELKNNAVQFKGSLLIQ